MLILLIYQPFGIAMMPTAHTITRNQIMAPAIARSMLETRRRILIHAGEGYSED